MSSDTFLFHDVSLFLLVFFLGLESDIIIIMSDFLHPIQYKRLLLFLALAFLPPTSHTLRSTINYQLPVITINAVFLQPAFCVIMHVVAVPDGRRRVFL